MSMKTSGDYEKLYDVGDVLYKVTKNGIKEITIVDIRQYPHYVYEDNYGTSYFNHNIGKSCFKTREEAEKEIIRRDNIAKKREMLKEYERKINEELGIINHLIIK